ncbi:MAG: phytanoyl-CoA dioxygenase family protein [Acidiferrobacterales bacterium]
MLEAPSEREIRQFHESGILFPLRVLEEQEAGRLLPCFESLRERMRDWSYSAQILKPHLVSTWVHELVRHPRVLDPIEALIGPDILCWSASFFAKRAHDPRYVGWHQDITYWGLRPAEEVVTVWLALTESTTENGCMRVVPGTHLGKVRPHVCVSGTDNMLMSEQEVSLTLDDCERIVDVELAPGEMSIHHSRLLHGSTPNPSSCSRIGLSINYMPTHARQVASDVRDSAMLVRGTDRYGHFDLEPGPQSDFNGAAIAAYKKSMRTPSGTGRAGNNPRDYNRLDLST